MWKTLKDNCPIDDKTYLVCWRDPDGNYSAAHRAYYSDEDEKFFSLENNNSHPLHVDIYFEIPEIYLK
jgi:hypothetical protein